MLYYSNCCCCGDDLQCYWVLYMHHMNSCIGIWRISIPAGSKCWLLSFSREVVPRILPAARCQRRRQISSGLTLWTGLYSGSWKYEECDLQPTSVWRRREKWNPPALWNFAFSRFGVTRWILRRNHGRKKKRLMFWLSSQRALIKARIKNT